MQNVFLIIQIILSFLLVVAILLQSQGTGLGASWGGGGENYHTKRGMEKALMYLTAALTIVFSIVTVATGVLV